MRRKILLLVLIMFLVLNVIVLANDVEYDFRKTNWGMSKEQVKATEDKKTDYEDNFQLSYDEVTINGKDFACVYYFLEDKLYTSGYGFTGEYTNKNLYINDYEEIKETLIKKYGKPKIDKVTWKKDLFKDDKSYWGTAISGGDLSYLAGWETPDTEIDLMLWGEDYDIKLTLFYNSKELKEWAKGIREKGKDDKQEGLREKGLIILSGAGQEASEKFILGSGLIIFDMIHTGQHNFVVWLLDNNGKEVELLVNKIGFFNGSKAIRIDKTGIYLLDVSADGSWAIYIR